MVNLVSNCLFSLPCCWVAPLQGSSPAFAGTWLIRHQFIFSGIKPSSAPPRNDDVEKTPSFRWCLSQVNVDSFRQQDDKMTFSLPALIGHSPPHVPRSTFQDCTQITELQDQPPIVRLRVFPRYTIQIKIKIQADPSDPSVRTRPSKSKRFSPLSPLVPLFSFLFLLSRAEGI